MTGRRRFQWLSTAALAVALAGTVPAEVNASDDNKNKGRDDDARPLPRADAAARHARRLFRRGRQVFRFDTLGSERFFGDALRLHEAIETVSPRTALAVGLKVDIEALPRSVRRALAQGTLDLDDPANTVALIGLDAVVGVRGKVSGGRLTQIGITCALCHSTVDDGFAAGIGKRRDGWANRDLDVGLIVSLAPDLTPFADLLRVSVETVIAVLQSWGPGRFDAHLNLDGKAFRPDGATAAVLIPPAFGLAGVNLHTYTGWGSVPYWNAFVGNLEMGGAGTFFDPRLDDPIRFPVAAAAGFSDVASEPDRITSKLPALHFYQIALPAPRPPPGSFDPRAARRGERLFADKARCARCHVPPLFTEPGYNLRTPEEVGIDDFQSARSPTEGYRTTPLKGLWSHAKGGYYHDGRFATLAAVLDHYDAHFGLGLSAAEKRALEEYLKSL